MNPMNQETFTNELKQQRINEINPLLETIAGLNYPQSVVDSKIRIHLVYDDGMYFVVDIKTDIVHREEKPKTPKLFVFWSLIFLVSIAVAFHYYR